MTTVHWRENTEIVTNDAGMAALGGMGVMALNRFVRLPPRVMGFVGIGTSLSGLTSTFGNFCLYSDRILQGETRWENFAHATGSLVAFASMIVGYVSLHARVRPPVAVSVLALASFATDIVELVATATEVPDTKMEGRKSWWEFGVQCGLVFFFNLSQQNRHQIRRGVKCLFDPESVMLRSDDPMQQEIYELGGEIIAEAQTIRRPLQEKVVDSLVNLTLRDNKIRSNLLRFVCALPQVGDSPHEVVALARDFFLPIADRLPLWMRGLVTVGLRPEHIARWFEGVIAAAIKVPPNIMARQFLGGITDEQLTAIVRRLKKDRIAVTIDNLGEFATSDAAGERYLEICRRIARLLQSGDSCSLKLTGLTPHFDPWAPEAVMDRASPVYKRTRELFELYRERDLVGFIDAEHHEMNRLMYRFQMQLLDDMPGYRKGGFVIQEYQREGYEMLEEICQWAKRRGDRQALHSDDRQTAYVRLVKGAYHDQEICHAQQKQHPIPVYMRPSETNTNFRRCIDRLLEAHEYITPCIASHNVRDIVYAIVKAKKMGILHKLEIQMLLGMSDNLKKALARRGIKVRAYVPHVTQPKDGVPGDPALGIAYEGRRLIENGSAASRRNQINWDTDPREVLTLDDVSLHPADLAGVEAMPAEYQTTYPKNGFRPAPYLNPAEPGRLDRFWEEHARVSSILRSTADRPIGVPGCSTDERLIFRSLDPSRSVDPESVQTVATIQGMDERDLDKILEKAEAVQARWMAVTPEERREILLGVYQRILARRDYYAALVMHEAGKPIAQADADIKECLDGIAYASHDIRTKLEEGTFDRYESNGVAAVIPPWNFPAAIPFMHASMALASGSAVVLKPSEQTSRIAIEIAIEFTEVLRRRGHDPNVLQLLLTDRAPLSKRLVADKRVKTLSFTGSKAVGLQVASAAADRSVATELGGTNATVKALDQDPDRAIAVTQYGAFGQQGYKCSHTQTLFVHRSELTELLPRLREMAESTPVGSAHDPRTLVGPLFHPKTRAHLDELLAEIPPESIVFDGRKPVQGDDPQFVGPTVVLDHPRLRKEEFFGPLLNVIPYDSDEEVMKIIGESSYGLTFSILSSSPRIRALYLVRDLERGTGVMAGNLYSELPSVGAEVAVNPFGGPGSNLSGTGSKTGGPESIMTYLRPKKDLSPELKGRLERVPTEAEWRRVAKKKGNDFRTVTPTELQYPGRTDLLERTPLGRGLIVVDERMGLQTLERLLYAHLDVGNEVRLLVHRSREAEVGPLLSRLQSMGIDQTRLRLSRTYSTLATLNGSPHDPSIDPAEFQWVHLDTDLSPPARFYQIFRDPAQSERQRFITRILHAPPWIDDDHLRARLQIHRVLSINTQNSGDIEKVEI